MDVETLFWLVVVAAYLLYQFAGRTKSRQRLPSPSEAEQSPGENPLEAALREIQQTLHPEPVQRPADEWAGAPASREHRPAQPIPTPPRQVKGYAVSDFERVRAHAIRTVAPGSTSPESDSQALMAPEIRTLTREKLREAVVLAEILAPPRSLRRRH